ncbi:MAG: BGTF surface domain-containing protein [Halobacteriales archaeon]
MADSPSSGFGPSRGGETSGAWRGLALAALVVASAVGASAAFAAPAAASDHALSPSVGLASDVPGPIEYRDAGGIHTVVVAFDRSLDDPGNVTFGVRGRNLRGDPVSFSRPATGPDVTLRNGTRGNGSVLEDSVAVVRLGAGRADDLVTNATLTLDYDNPAAGSFERTFPINTTSTAIDAGDPEDATAYAGERVAIYNLTGSHDEYEVFADGAFQFSGQSGENTTVTVEFTGSDDFQAGVEYRFDFLDADAASRRVTGSARVDLRNLGLGAALDRGGESQPYPAFSAENVTINATVTSDVAGRFVRVEVLSSNATGAIESEVVDLRGGGADREATVSFRVNPDGNEVTYRARAVDAETGIEATSGGFTLVPFKGDLAFAENRIDAVRGDEVRFTVDLGSLREAHVEIRGDGGDYRAGFDAVDDDGDGTVTVVLDTYREGIDTPNATTVTADRFRHVTAEGGRVENYRKTHANPGTPLGAGTYTLGVALFEGGGSLDEATVRLAPRETGAARTLVAPAGAGSGGRLPDATTPGPEVAVGDTVVVAVNATGLSSVLDSGYDLSVDPDNPDYATHGVGVRVAHVDGESGGVGEGGGPSKGDALPLDAAETIVDADSGVVYVAFDTRELAVAPGETYEATFLVNGTLSPFEEPGEGEVETASTTFTVRERTITWGATTNATGVVTVEAEETTIAGRTTAAPGTTFRIEVQSEREDIPLTRTGQATVGPEGRFAATFDFGGEEVETGLEAGPVPFTLTVEDAGTGLPTVANATLPGVVRPPPTATIGFDDQTIAGDAVTVQSASLSRGGFVAIHEGSPDGPVLGVSAFLGPGPHEDVQVVLEEQIPDDGRLVAVAHRDTDGDEQFDFPEADDPYTADGDSVAAEATVGVSTATPTPTEVTPTPTPTDVTTTDVTPTPTDVTPTPTVVTPTSTDATPTRTGGTTTADSPTTTDTPTTPGMGLLVGVVALLAAALLAIRRR